MVVCSAVPLGLGLFIFLIRARFYWLEGVAFKSMVGHITMIMALHVCMYVQPSYAKKSCRGVFPPFPILILGLSLLMYLSECHLGCSAQHSEPLHLNH